MTQVADIASVVLNSVLAPAFVLLADLYSASAAVAVNVVEPVLQPVATMYPSAYPPVDGGDQVSHCTSLHTNAHHCTCTFTRGGSQVIHRILPPLLTTACIPPQVTHLVVLAHSFASTSCAYAVLTLTANPFIKFQNWSLFPGSLQPYMV